MSASLSSFLRSSFSPAPGSPCRFCHGGEWFTECCNGSGGCSCGGDIVPMGRCHVCGGSGIEPENADPGANVAAIEGFGLIGTGPQSSGLYDDLPRMGWGRR